MLSAPDLHARPSAPRHHRWLSIAFWLIAAVPVIVVLIVPALVVQDGGLHISNAVALQGLIEGRWPLELEWRTALAPNTTVELALLGLIQLTSADIAVRVIVVLTMLAHAMVVALLTRALRIPLYAGIPLLLFQMNFLLMMGLLGFAAAAPMALLAIVITLRRPATPRLLPLLFILAATWLTHIVPAIVATLTVGAIVLFARLGDGERLGRAAWSTIRLAGPPALPVIVLSAWWLLGNGTANLAEHTNRFEGLKNMLEFSGPLVAYPVTEYWIARLVAVSCYAAIALAVLHRRRARLGWQAADGLLAAGLILTTLAIVLPENSATGAILVATRLTLFAAMMLVAWVISQRPKQPDQPAAAAVRAPRRNLSVAFIVAWWVAFGTMTAAAVSLPLGRLPALHHLADEAAEINSLAPCLPESTTFVQLNLDNAGALSARGMSPMAEQTGHLAAARHALDLGNESGWYPYFLWRYTDRARADRALQIVGHFDHVPPTVNLTAGVTSNLNLGAVVLYGTATASGQTMAHDSTRRLIADLDRYYVLAATSPHGNAQLWLRRNLPRSC